MILQKSEIKKLIENEQMITGYKNLDEQLQPNGFDLTLKNISDFYGVGSIFISTKYIPMYHELLPDAMNTYSLYKDRTYMFSVNETVKLPLDVCALTIQRSSIMRCGLITNVGFWDSGYNGSGQSNIFVGNDFMIEKNARIIQMIFMKNISKTEGYRGQYQFEGIKSGE